MRVCFISESFFPPDIGGAEISTSILADALSQEGIKIYVLTKKHKNYPIIEKKGNLTILRFFDLPKSKFFNENVFFHRSRTYMASIISLLDKKYNFDIVHAHNKDTILALSLASIQGAKIATIRDHWPFCLKRDLVYFDHPCRGQSFRCIKCLFFRDEVLHPRVFLRPFWNAYILSDQKNVQKCFLKFDLVIAISEYLKARMVQYHHRVVRLYNPISSIISSNSENISTHSLLYVGKFYKSKGIETLIRAFSCVVSSEKNVTLTVIGEGPLFLQMRRLAHRLSLSHYVQFISTLSPDELAHYYNNSSIVVVPSILNEPFGRVVAEAFSHGKPVIASRVGGLPELVFDNVNGLLFEPNDVDGLSNKILTLLHDTSLYKKMADATKNFLPRFTPSLIAKELISIYKSVSKN